MQKLRRDRQALTHRVLDAIRQGLPNPRRGCWALTSISILAALPSWPWLHLLSITVLPGAMTQHWALPALSLDCQGTEQEVGAAVGVGAAS